MEKNEQTEEADRLKACTDQATELLFDIEFKSISDEQDAVKAVTGALMAAQDKGEALYKAVVEYICIDEDNGFDKLKEAATAYGWDGSGEDPETHQDPPGPEVTNPEPGAVVQSAKSQKDGKTGSNKS